MKSVIINRSSVDTGIPSGILSILPYKVSDAVRAAARGRCEEIRLRRGGLSTLTISGNLTVPMKLHLTDEDMNEIVARLCQGSLYAHGDTIKNGYIILPGGLRAGVCGRAASEGGKIFGVSDISSVSIRIPHRVNSDASLICKLLLDMSYTKGVLIYSPPGEGKTTVLRSAAAMLAREKLRVAVVDTRGELEFGLTSEALAVDILSFYPKAVGIEIALRTLNAEVIVCDEIGSEDETKALGDAANGGAALLASAHATDIASLMSKKSIRALHESGAFGAYVGIKRVSESFIYTVSKSDEVKL